MNLVNDRDPGRTDQTDHLPLNQMYHNRKAQQNQGTGRVHVMTTIRKDHKVIDHVHVMITKIFLMNLSREIGLGQGMTLLQARLEVMTLLTMITITTMISNHRGNGHDHEMISEHQEGIDTDHDPGTMKARNRLGGANGKIAPDRVMTTKQDQNNRLRHLPRRREDLLP